MAGQKDRPMTNVARVVAAGTVFGLVVAAGVPRIAVAQQPDAAPAAAAEAPPQPAAPQDARQQMIAQFTAAGEAVLAENLAETARNTIRQIGIQDNTSFRLAAALLQASTKLNPRNPRLWQLLVEAQLQLGDREGALASLNELRKLDPNDRVVQIQLIEFYADRIESADQEIGYLRGIVAKQTVPDEVRAHTGVMVARRLLERGETGAAVEAVNEALKLNPVHVAGLDLKYRLIAPTATAAERADALVAAVRANPARPGVQGELGRVLAEVGLTREALDWMNRALQMYGRQQNRDPAAVRGLFIDLISQLTMAGQIQPARANVGPYLDNNPGDIDAWLLRLTLERAAGDKDAYGKSLAGAQAALNAQWAGVARAARGEPPTTQPADASVPPADPAQVVEQVKAAQDPRLQASFVAAASDQAWFELFFNQQPDAAGKWVAALEAVLPADSVTLQRLRGWQQLASGQPDNARATLAAIRDQDPLAELGILTLDANVADPDARKAGDDRARKLLEDNRGGVLGAILAVSLKDRGLQPAPHPQAADVRAALGRMPRGWLDIVDQASRFYQVRVDPERVAYGYAEPMFALVTIKNVTNEPLTVGDDGIIQPGMLIEMRTMQPHPVGGASFVRIGRSTVVPPRGELQQYIRVDQGEIGLLLNNDPTPRYQITGFIMTNPRAQGEGLVAGLAGTRVQFSRKITRIGVERRKPATFDKIYQELEIGLPDTRMRNATMLTSYIAMIAQQQQQQQQAVDPQAMAADRQLAGVMLDKLGRAADDEIPPVREWVRYQLARVLPLADRKRTMEALLADARWEARLLGLLGAGLWLDPASRDELVHNFAERAKANEAEEPAVKAFATELSDLLKRTPPASTQPVGEAPAPPAAAAPPTTTEPAPAPEQPAPAPQDEPANK
jgi:tetratricopeptide (TPR) repeat protein